MVKSKKKPIDIPGIPKDFGNVLALLDGREPTDSDSLQLADGAKIEDILSVMTALTANPPKPAFDPSKLEIGQMVKGKGIYFGVQEITTKGGLTQTFDLYAAPEDLTDAQDEKLVTTYNKAVIALSLIHI